MAIAASVLASAIASGPEFFHGPAPFFRLALPVVASLLGLVIADAYRVDAGPRDARRRAAGRMRPVHWAFVAGGLTQFVLFFLRPDWFLPPKLTLLASALIFLLLMAVRASVMSDPASSTFAPAGRVSATTPGTESSIPPRDARRHLYRMLLVHGILGAVAVYFLDGIARLPWLAMGLVSLYSAFRVRRLPESPAVSETERLEMARRRFLRWMSTPIVTALIGAVLLNPLRHPEQPELLLRAAPALTLALVWYWSAWKRSRRTARA